MEIKNSSIGQRISMQNELIKSLFITLSLSSYFKSFRNTDVS
jgi:hypothetical protein